jgi:hypothetical protein
MKDAQRLKNGPPVRHSGKARFIFGVDFAGAGGSRTRRCYDDRLTDEFNMMSS